jgi:hypothetical protein
MVGVVALLHAAPVRVFDVAYRRVQSHLEPHPRELMLVTTSEVFAIRVEEPCRIQVQTRR